MKDKIAHNVISHDMLGLIEKELKLMTREEAEEHREKLMEERKFVRDEITNGDISDCVTSLNYEFSNITSIHFIVKIADTLQVNSNESLTSANIDDNNCNKRNGIFSVGCLTTRYINVQFMLQA